MAGYPPSYPPPPGYSPREQARLLRAQTRAMQESAKAQSRLFREQARGLRRRSILGPVLILAVGILLLLGRLGHLAATSLLTWYGRWWPLLLVVAGLILLAEWAWDERLARQQPAGTAPYIRRGIGGGVIFLLIFLAVAGAVLRGSTGEGVDTLTGFFNSGNGFGEFLGEHHEQDQTLDLDLPRNTEFVVDNPHGDVTLTGSSNDGRVHVLIHKRIYSSSADETARKFRALAPNAQLSMGALRLSVPSLDGGTADLTLSVPPAVASSLSANHGEVHVSGLAAPVHVTSNRGDVELASITGAVIVRLNSRNSSLAAHDIHGDLSLQGTGQDLTLTNLTGTVTLNGDFYGDTHLEQLAGPVRFQTSRTSVSFASLKGSFDISPHAELTGTGITGPTTIDTHSRNITLDQAAGDVSISNRNGTVDLQAATPAGNISIVDESGAITLTLPDPSNATLRAESRDGKITDQFAPQSATQGNLATLDGKLGTGAVRINLRTSNADVTIRKAEGH